nr:methyl-CpG-binding domain-containing protein 7-like [Ipomoea trifida]
MPPSKVNWGLASPKGDAWNPIVDDTLISDAVKQQWRKRFVSAMNNESCAVMRPQITEQQPQIAENIEQTQFGEGGRQDEGGLRRSSRTKKGRGYSSEVLEKGRHVHAYVWLWIVLKQWTSITFDI